MDGFGRVDANLQSRYQKPDRTGEVNHTVEWKRRSSDELASYGAGPRASQYLVLGAKARAAMDGRSVPDLDDVRAICMSVLRHRVVLNFQTEAEGVGADVLIEQVLKGK